MHPKRHIAILGGTGKEGSGLALHWANAGHRVILGSRDVERAREAAAAINTRLGAERVTGAASLEAAQNGDVIVLAVPPAAQKAVALDVRAALSGKVLIDVTAPLVPPRVDVVQLPKGGSVVQALQAALGPEVRVVSAFQNVSAPHLQKLDHPVDCDVLVCADDDDAGQVAVELAEDIGMRAWRCGPLANSIVSEGLTSVLIAINKRYKIPGAGIRITGTPRQAEPAPKG